MLVFSCFFFLILFEPQKRGSALQVWAKAWVTCGETWLHLRDPSGFVGPQTWMGSCFMCIVHVCACVCMGSFRFVWLVGFGCFGFGCDFVVGLALIVFNIFGGRSLLPGYKTKWRTTVHGSTGDKSPAGKTSREQKTHIVDTWGASP